ncbi:MULTISPECIES: hypothetical protein [unclassified Variovorax]|uniref:hypothetical protein n=1 Tax=unclassified Variovorax TaxID=663243 RepID=UPI00131C50F6|nr:MULTISPECIES: hypothetical protein [unclassified Variovorax]QRY33055.1 hypothetical protein JVX96_07105 [Variovorax sp. PDNC026]
MLDLLAVWFTKYWYLIVPIAVIALIVFVLTTVAKRQVFRVMGTQSTVNRQVMGTDRAERVLRTGQPAVGVVLESHDTATRVERIYILVRLKLQVQPGDGSPAYETELVAPISPVKIADFAPGRSVKLRFDPVSREIAIDQPVR